MGNFSLKKYNAAMEDFHTTGAQARDFFIPTRGAPVAGSNHMHTAVTPVDEEVIRLVGFRVWYVSDAMEWTGAFKCEISPSDELPQEQFFHHMQHNSPRIPRSGDNFALLLKREWCVYELSPYQDADFVFMGRGLEHFPS